MTRYGLDAFAIGLMLAATAGVACQDKEAGPPVPAAKTGDPYGGDPARAVEASGESEDSAVTAPPGGIVAPMGGGAAGCPMAAVGSADDVEVAVEDTADGVALSLTTEGDAERVSELRRAVEGMAQQYETGPRDRQMMWRHMRDRRDMPATGMRGGLGMGAGPMPAVETSVETVQDGARITMTPTDASQLEALRQHVRRHQQRMEAGECWMWSSDDAPAQQ